MKKYAKDMQPEEVIECLRQGQILRCDDNQTLEIIDDFFVGKRGNEWCINPIIGTGSIEQYYFDIPEPELNLKVGEFYRRRDGKKAYVFNESEEGKFACAVDNEMPYGVFKNGCYSEEEDTDKDIVELWEKPQVFVKRNKPGSHGGEKNKRKRLEILSCLKEGMSYSEIRQKTGASAGTISSVKKANGFKMRREQDGGNIEKYRTLILKGYTLQQIADCLDRSVGTVSHYIYTNPELSELKKRIYAE